MYKNIIRDFSRIYMVGKLFEFVEFKKKNQMKVNTHSHNIYIGIFFTRGGARVETKTLICIIKIDGTFNAPRMSGFILYVRAYSFSNVNSA